MLLALLAACTITVEQKTGETAAGDSGGIDSGEADSGDSDSGTPDTAPCTDNDADGYAADCEPMDCDDGDARVFPSAEELCDGTDRNCDGDATAGATDTITFYEDGDADGFGATPVQACAQPGATSLYHGDCDDADATVFPGAYELCDELDHDCDGDATAGATDTSVYYADIDGDGFGGDASIETCTQPEYTALVDGDCDDDDATTFPGADELCDEIDHDCDGDPTAGAIDPKVWYDDLDADGFGTTPVEACTQAAGTAALDGDCDDADSTVFPGADERCDEIDQNCDGDPTAGAVDPSVWYDDLDGDGSGSAINEACTQPEGTATVDGDCDDADSTVFPGADELCDEIDQDCDGDPTAGAIDPGTYYEDADADGFGVAPVEGCPQPAGTATVDGDCDDADPTVHDTCAADCSTLVTWDGDITFSGTGAGPEMATFCTTYNAVGGDLELSYLAVDDLRHLECLCEVGGTLRIESNYRLVSLTGLHSLRRVGDELYVDLNTQLADLSGLMRLEEVGGSLLVYDNTLVRSYAGLSSLTRVGWLTLPSDFADFSGLESLTTVDNAVTVEGGSSLDGLESLEFVGTYLWVDGGEVASLEPLAALRTVDTIWLDGLDNLVSLEGLEGVTTMSDLRISQVPLLPDLRGLAGLHGDVRQIEVGLSGVTSLTGLEGVERAYSLLVWGNDGLTNLTGLDGLVSVETDATIYMNDALASLDGLDGLAAVRGELSVTGNPTLRSVDGLESLRYVRDLELTYNQLESLSALVGLESISRRLTVNEDSLADLDGLHNVVSVGDNLWIHTGSGNFVGLDALTEIGGDLDLDESAVGLEHLLTIRGELSIGNGDTHGLDALNFVGDLSAGGLADLGGLNALEVVDDELWIDDGTLGPDLPALRTVGTVWLTGCTGDPVAIELAPTLEQVHGRLWIEGCSSVELITGLGALEQVDGLLAIGSMPALTALPDWTALDHAAGLRLSHNSALSALAGLAGLTALDGELELSDNASLVDLSPLYGIRRVEGEFVLVDNASLDVAAAEALRDTIGTGNIHGSIVILE